MNVTREVIKDLLPLYQEGEVSPDTRQLVEEYLAKDSELRDQVAASGFPPRRLPVRAEMRPSAAEVAAILRAAADAGAPHLVRVRRRAKVSGAPGCAVVVDPLVGRGGSSVGLLSEVARLGNFNVGGQGPSRRPQKRLGRIPRNPAQPSRQLP